MKEPSDHIINDVRHLLDEEAHLIGQELQDALHKDQSRRLIVVSQLLDELDDMLKQHRALRPTGCIRVPD